MKKKHLRALAIAGALGLATFACAAGLKSKKHSQQAHNKSREASAPSGTTEPLVEAKREKAAAAPTSGTGQEFTLVTANIWHGASHGCDISTGEELGPRATLDGLSDFLRKHVDGGLGLVALQEVLLRKGKVPARPEGPPGIPMDPPATFVKALGAKWTSFYAPTTGVPDGTTGDAVLTNLPVSKEQKWGFAFDGKKADKHSPRGAQVVKVAFDDDNMLWLVSVHLDTIDEVAVNELREMLAKVDTLDRDVPVIVAGDFNLDIGRDSAPGATFRELLDAPPGGVSTTGFRTACSTTTKTSLPLSSDEHRCIKTEVKPHKVLDYVFVRDPKQRLEVLGCEATEVANGTKFYADHKAQVVKLRWR